MAAESIATQARRRVPAEIRQLLSFIAIGVGAALGFIGLSQVLIGRLDMPDWITSGLLYAAMVVPVYLLHRRFSFASAAPHGRALPRYLLLQTALVALSALFSFIAYGTLGLPTPAAALLVIVLTSGASFAASRAWVFAEGTMDAKSLLNAVHDKAVFGRRVEVLARELARQLPQGGRVLDLGAGDGSVARALMDLRPDLVVEGVDVMIRPRTLIPVTKFDGGALPFADKSFDAVTIVDVLHHTDDPAAVMGEAARVARHAVVIKDHLLSGLLAGPTLRFMDWVGNRGHNVVLPYNYLSSERWSAALTSAGLAEETRESRLNLYPRPFTWLFDRNLHFVARFRPLA